MGLGGVSLVVGGLVGGFLLRRKKIKAKKPSTPSGSANTEGVATSPGSASSVGSVGAGAGAGGNHGAQASSTQSSAPAPAPASAPAATGGSALLAQMKARRAAQSSSAKKSSSNLKAKPVFVLYASQTGTCREIAKNLAAEASTKGFQAKALDMREVNFDNLSVATHPVLVLVTSSTGDGDPPDNAAKLYTKVRKKRPASEKPFAGIKYTSLGLGDSNYTRFMHVPRQFNKKFADLGAESFYKSVEADEVDGIEPIIEAWTEDLWGALTFVVTGEKPAGAGDAAAAAAAALPAVAAPWPAQLPCVKWLSGTEHDTCLSTEAKAPARDAIQYRDPKGMYSPDEPFFVTAPITCRYLTAGGVKGVNGRKVMHVELDVAGSGIRYNPGDAVGVSPENDPSLVDSVLSRLGLNADATFMCEGIPHVPCPCSVRHVFSHCVDISGALKKSLVRSLAPFCKKAEERSRMAHLASKDGAKDFEKHVANHDGLLQILTAFPSCAPPLACLLDALPPLAPRLYSLTSAMCDDGERLSAALSVVEYAAKDGTSRRGVASTWLERVASASSSSSSSPSGAIGVHLRKSAGFRPPVDVVGSSVIMVGPGTGVAPYRGFLKERKFALTSASADATRGDWMLFFGCRHPEEDYLYREEFEKHAADGTLTKLVTAFSRVDGQPKSYVQHRLKELGKDVNAALARGASIFVCGDGAGMAKDVRAAFADIMVTHGDMTGGEAEMALQKMVSDGRYVTEVWCDEAHDE
ncbi:NADPH-ferrihemoprotein reductase [Pseudoscourfieldia marina]